MIIKWFKNIMIEGDKSQWKWTRHDGKFESNDDVGIQSSRQRTYIDMIKQDCDMLENRLG